MQFSSIEFLFLFLPVFLAVYFLAPVYWRNTALVLASILFYAIGVSWQPLPIALLLVITAVTYVIGRLIRHPALKILFWPAIIFMAAILVLFKCYNGGKLLPVGMSFYMFQISAYLISVYRGKMQAEKDLIAYGTQILMFPKLLMGPMVDPLRLKAQVYRRKCDMKLFHNGLQLLILGLAMKVMLANRIGSLWTQPTMIGYENISPIFAWLSLVGYAMKLYYDFFGYSLMAVGLGRMLGFQLPHNFMDPYASKSVSEFYRRWHVTLGEWFRENIYIPMGGNRKGMVRTILNLLVVWAFTGFWHGVGGNYILWAGILVAFIILERLVLGKFLKKTFVLGHVYTILVILVSWVPFAIGDWDQMRIFMGRLVGLCGFTANAQDYVTALGTYSWLLVAGVVLATPLPRWIWHKIRETWIADILCFVLFWISVYYIATAAQDPFMYGQY